MKRRVEFGGVQLAATTWDCVKAKTTSILPAFLVALPDVERHKSTSSSSSNSGSSVSNSIRSMARKGTFVWVAIAAVVAAVAVFWPQIEHQLAAQGVGCPWPFSHLAKTGDASSDAATQDRNDFSPLLPSYTVEELKK